MKKLDYGEKLFELFYSGDETNIDLAITLADAVGEDLTLFWAGVEELFQFINPEMADGISLRDKLAAVQGRSSLYKSMHKLENLPEYIGLANNLRNLNLEHNLLKRLPESLGEMKNLSEISLWDNQLRYLPESIGNLY